jgi:Zn-dependent protease with chaperone function/uncharacterized tellurite resistance protein B-like protein
MKNFFEQQERARKKTTLLVVLYLAAVSCIVAGLYFITLFATSHFFVDTSAATAEAASKVQLWHYPTFLLTLAISTVVIGGGTLYKIFRLSSKGGAGVAEDLGGRQITRPTAQNLREKQLLNVVEEMAIASGTSMPDVYVMDDEEAINAFAAGWEPGSAAVAVTEGALQRLDRQELQGVIAHEFSHIFNGDMQLNIKLMGILHGILLIALTGQFLVRGSLWGSATTHRRSSNDSSKLAIVGLGLLIIGYVGVFFARIIQSSVSRAREYLADASAVQYTRNPDGIGSALKKIGGWQSEIQNPNSDETSHFFFGDPKTGWLAGLFATHPPLPERISKIDPSFDGEFEEAKPLSDEAAIQDDRLVSKLSSDSAAKESSKTSDVETSSPADRAGTIDAEQIAQAHDLLANLTPSVAMALEDTHGTIALTLALILAENDNTEAELAFIEDSYSETMTHQIKEIRQSLSQMPRSHFLPLVQISMPLLRQMSEQQYSTFKTRLQKLVGADDKITLFEFCLAKVVTHHLDQTFQANNASRQSIKSVSQVEKQVQYLLSLLAFVPDKTQEEAAAALDKASAQLRDDIDLSLVPSDKLSFQKLSSILDKLGQTTAPVKEKIIRACTECIRADDQLDVEETELLRTVCEILEVPVPPSIQ